VCTLNGRALPLKQTWRLNDGDVIEIGFVRMQVKLQDEPQLFLSADHTHASQEADFAPFNLVALASDNAQPKLRDGLQKPDDDISDLIRDTAAAPDFQSMTMAPAAGQAAAAAVHLVEDTIGCDLLVPSRTRKVLVFWYHILNPTVS
jgi:predicted component of type VI protein secretion system